MNELVRMTIKELDKQAETLATNERFTSNVDSDMYAEDFNLVELTYFSHKIDNYESYTLAQIIYILDKAITIATI